MNLSSVLDLYVYVCVYMCLSYARLLDNFFFSPILLLSLFLTFHSLSIEIDPIDRFIHTFRLCRSLLDRGDTHSLKSAVVDNDDGLVSSLSH